MSKLRLIQAGVGGMGKAWWTTATRNSPDFDLAAIVDISDAALAEAGDAIGIPQERRFKSLESALDAVQADALLTVTPPAIHVEHAQLAFSRGLHLLTEKPIAHDLAAAKRMVQLARDAKRQLTVTQNYRYNAPMTALRQLVSQNPVGPIGHGHIDFYIPADFTGTFRETMEFPLLVDMAIHHLDLIRAVTGKNIRRVTAHTFKPTWSWYQHHPGLKMLLELDDGVSFSYSGDWSGRGRSTAWNGTWRLQGEHGSIELLKQSGKEVMSIAPSERWLKNETTEQIEIPPLEQNGQQILLTRFAQAIRTNTPAETSGEDNLWSFAAVIAGTISAQQKKSVDVASLLAG